MKPEQSSFYITHEVSREVLSEAKSGDRLEFVRRARRKVAGLHSLMYKQLDEQIIFEPLSSAAYETSALIMYESIARQLSRNDEQIEISEQDIKAHQRSSAIAFKDSKIEKKQVAGGIHISYTLFVPEGMNRFLYILEARAPHLYKEIEKNELQEDENANTRASLQGYYDGFMPFYLKYLKMRELGQSLKNSGHKI